MAHHAQGQEALNGFIEKKRTRGHWLVRESSSCGEWIRTTDLQVMSLASCHCSTPRLVRAAPPCFVHLLRKVERPFTSILHK
jgi:hypothetical protein